MAVAIGWVDSASKDFATVERCSLSTERYLISCTENTPSVRVPVLSKAMEEMWDIFSNASSPLMRIPFLAEAPIAAKYVRGTESTRAQGQDITRSMAAL